MTSIGEWLQSKIIGVHPNTAGVGFLLLVLSLFVSAGSSAMTAFGMPARKVAVDSLRIEVQAMYVGQRESNRIVQDHIRIETAQKERDGCVIDALWQFITDEERTPINPNRCAGGDQ